MWPQERDPSVSVAILAQDIVASLQAFGTFGLCLLPKSRCYSAVAAMTVAVLAGAFAILLVGRGCAAADDLPEICRSAV
eukprot:7092738-Pyramimonas_sp.AAC.1